MTKIGRPAATILVAAALAATFSTAVAQEYGTRLGNVRRGGEVSFDPPQVKVWEDTRTGANSPWAPLWFPPEPPEDGRWTVDVTFDQPGTYLLRGRADDGGLFADVELTVVVRPAAS